MDTNFNRVSLCGTVQSPPQLSHVNHNLAFYKFPLSVERLSGQSDILQIIVSQEQLAEKVNRELHALDADKLTHRVLRVHDGGHDADQLLLREGRDRELRGRGLDGRRHRHPRQLHGARAVGRQVGRAEELEPERNLYEAQHDLDHVQPATGLRH